ncbi:MAG: amidohydrolase [bacterium]|nr:amidohydrolase [bacterium]
MNLRFYHAYILTLEEHEAESGMRELWVRDDRIVYIGQPADEADRARRMKQHGIAPHGFDREIDCAGDVLMPGFKNAHAHSGMTLLRSIADDLPLAEWLQEQIFPREAQLSPQDIKTLTKLAVMEYVSGGVTAVFDMYLSPDEIAEAFIETGMRCVQCGTVNNFTHSAAQLEEYYLRLNERHPLLGYRLGFHAEYTTDRALLEQVAALAEKYRAPVYMHLSETEREVAECKQRYGMSPVAFLDSIGMFDHGGAGYHCVHVSEEDMEILAAKGVGVVTNPASNMKLVSGIAPIRDLVERGICVAVGTDGPASNNGLDMFREMYLLSVLAKYREQEPAAVSPMQILTMAAGNGARIMGLPDCTSLREGAKADVIRVDMKQPEMRPLHGIPDGKLYPSRFAANLVYSGSKRDVRMTVVDGRILYEDGRYNLNMNRDELYAEVERIADRIVYGKA